MIRKAKKRTLFLMGMLITGLLSTVGTYSRSNYSKDDSLFASKAYADLDIYNGGVGGGDGGGDAACGGCGGCSGSGGGSK